MIEDNLLAVFKAFNDQSQYDEMTVEMKEKWFFIFNRYFSKKYPKQAQLLNSKLIDKSTGLDIWFHFFKDKPYPKWFWSKSGEKEKPEFPEKDFKLLFEKLNLNKKEDLTYLIDKFPDFIEEELKYYKKKGK